MLKLKMGVIINLSSAKSVLVRVKNVNFFEKYKTLIFKHKNYLVDSNILNYNLGDIVVIQLSNKKSKKKSWTIIKKIY